MEKTWFAADSVRHGFSLLHAQLNWDKAGTELQVGIDTVFLGKAGCEGGHDHRPLPPPTRFSPARNRRSLLHS